MSDEIDTTLNEVLACWHRWALGYSPLPVSGVDPMFRGVPSNKSWDTTSDAFDSDLNHRQMEAVDCQVNELPDDDGRAKGGPNRAYRSAIHAHARNLHTGVAVWASPRLPADPMERAVVLMEAKNMLTRRLRAAGVL
ncbi:MAG TPA: hypothetical protein VMS38_02215 [Pseudorhodoferax sp.]|nr:hypothetical protein [Pseudorhodoferax sp.]